MQTYQECECCGKFRIATTLKDVKVLNLIGDHTKKQKWCTDCIAIADNKEPETKELSNAELVEGLKTGKIKVKK